MKFCNPNLPQGKVKEMLVSSLLPDSIINELISLGVSPIKMGHCTRIASELSYHPDILTLNYAPGKWLLENKSSVEEASFVYPSEHMNIMLTHVKYHIGNKYPADCIFNSFIIGKKVFCGSINIGMYEHIEELYGLESIQFKQGYAKCSTIIVNDHSFITGDKSIEKKLTELQYDCLYVSNESVRLNGYKNGFIGGCAGKLSNNLLAFTGNIKNHLDYTNIKDFCANHGVELYSLDSDPLYDYGGLLPVTEHLGF